MATALLYTCIVLFILVCLFLIMVILIQKGRGGGLASAFGGAGGNTAFGSKTGDVLTWVTSVVFGIFLLLAVVLNLLSDYRSRNPAQAVALPGQTTQTDQTPAATQPAATEVEQPKPAATPASQPAK
jgi:preprotein translocase subunit SecG